MTRQSHRIIDHIGREISLPTDPRGIISLCPSQTETLLALGARDRVIGRTRYCIHPAELVERIPHVDGTKTPDIQRIQSLAPDLIIAEKEENTPETVEILAREFPVYVTDVVDIDGSLRMIRDLGAIVGNDNAAATLCLEIQHALGDLRPLSRPARAAYLIWRKPWMGASSGTFIDSLMRKCGFVNALSPLPGRYPEISAERLRELAPEVVLLSSEPFPFGQKHIAEIEAILPDTKVFLTDGECFSWYGARMARFGGYADPFLRSIERSLIRAS